MTQLRSESTESFPNGDTYMLTEQQKSNLEQVYRYQDMLRACLKMCVEITSVQAGTTTSVEVFLDKKEPSIIVEFSLFRPLVAVFLYDSVPTKVLQHVDNCLRSLGVIQLSTDEIKELADKGLYHELF